MVQYEQVSSAPTMLVTSCISIHDEVNSRETVQLKTTSLGGGRGAAGRRMTCLIKGDTRQDTT